MANAQQIKAWAESHWNDKGVLNAKYGNVFTLDNGHTRVRAGTARNYKSKEQKAYEARFGIYNEKLRPVILAEANKSDASYMMIGDRKLTGPIYTWEKQYQVPTGKVGVESVPRKRVPKAKLEQAAAIIAKVPQDELAAFLAKFGLSMALAASIASLDNAEMIARQFLRATL